MKPPTWRAAPLYLWALPNVLIGLLILLYAGPMLWKWHSGALVVYVKRLPGGKWVEGQTHGWLVLLKDPGNPSLRVHEFVHVKQQLLLGVFFYLWYGAEYVAHRMRGLKHSEAYRAIYFERVAYRVQSEFKAGQRPGAWGS